MVAFTVTRSEVPFRIWCRSGWVGWHVEKVNYGKCLRSVAKADTWRVMDRV
ncbi:Uncharacterized protein DAT39_020208, partial [Clarias magur]